MKDENPELRKDEGDAGKWTHASQTPSGGGLDRFCVDEGREGEKEGNDGVQVPGLGEWGGCGATE